MAMNATNRRLAPLAGACLLFCLPMVAHAQLDLPLVYTNGAVLQRDQPMHVLGWSTPGSTVRATFDGKSARANAGSDGHFDIALPAHKAGGPYVLTVDNGKEHRDISDVLVGDVWLCSGQSNMEFMVLQTRDATREIANGTDPAIRHFKIPNSWAATPDEHLAGGEWAAASPATVGRFSAACWFFAREMKAKSGVAQGLINSTWGGSRIEAWMNASSAGVRAEDVAAHMKQMDADEQVKTDETRQHLARWDQTTPPGGTTWALPDLDTKDWVPINVPGYWEDQGYYGMDGTAWYRTTFTLSARQAAKGITLGLGTIDDSDTSFVNGTQVGATQARWNDIRAYRVAPGNLHAGTNTIAVKVEDLANNGGIYGDANLLYIQTYDGEKHPLKGPWLFHPDAVTVTATTGRNELATLLYNKMIHPIVGYPLRGVLWYQGEANANPREALAYREQFAGLIRQWRGEWKQPALPFVWVQLANWISGIDTADESPWAELRESQSANLALPATAEAVIIDIGNPKDIHPTNKQDVGHRLALAMRHAAFGDTATWSGPRYRNLKIDGANAIVGFDLYGGQLAVRGGGLPEGFEVAGDDQHFHPATARIEGSSIVVSNAEVGHPVAVRYGWSDNPEHANVTNEQGLPASPFRTEGAIQRSTP
ncbi:sialate O-acetylesterase [Luteibacter sp. OK325]|nr:sialate O-acetylesterase [Luteibacter sp. OK325]